MESKIDQLFVLSRSGSGHVLTFDIICGILTKKPALQVWPAIESLKEFACVSHKQFVFIIGGFNLRLKKTVQNLKRFNTLTNEWLELPSMESERRLCTAAVLKDEIIVCGGFANNNKLHTTTEIFNLTRNVWRKGPTLSKGVSDMQLITTRGSIYGFGGIKSSHFNKKSILCGTDEILEYREWSRQWSNMDDNVPLVLGKPVYNHSVVEVDSKIYIIGGLKTVLTYKNEIKEVINNHMESFHMDNNQLACLMKNNLKDWISPWDRSLPAPNVPRYGAAAISLGSDIYLFGGVSACQPNGVVDVEKFNTKHRKWSNEFSIKLDGVDLTMVSALTIRSSNSDDTQDDYRFHEESPIPLESEKSEFESESDTEQTSESIDLPKEIPMYRVGWVLW